MKKMTMLAIVLVLALTLCACGSKVAAPETTASAETTAAPAETTVPAEPLELTDWTMSATTWSSPNGATIHIAATPNYYAEGQKVDFVVRLEGDDVAVVPCQWDGTVYTASADLNAADGYCYYMILTATDGTATEVAVNTPTDPVNTAYIDMESALQARCSIFVEESTFDTDALTLTAGKVELQVPSLTNQGETVSCQEAALVLMHNGQELSKQPVTLTETDVAHHYEAQLTDITFTVPELENEEKLELMLSITLTDGQTLCAYGGNWIYSTEDLLLVVG